MSEAALQQVAVVVIGRNEGERLRQCLMSIDKQVAGIVYVDSGSTDQSVTLAQSLGAQVVELDPSVPFTAARARNVGIEHAQRLAPTIQFIQVIDGDCELIATWFERALETFAQHPNAAVVCGRRRERFPHSSVYNQLTDMEWDTSIGETTDCGGDALIRLQAFREVSGYNATLIAGEEPEICLRLLRAGWKIHRIATEMTLHDVQMMHFGQWWRRTERSGHAFAEGRALHGAARERFCVHEVRSIVEWGFLLPAAALMAAWFTWGASLLLLGGYFLLWQRVRAHRLEHGDPPALADLYARYIVIGKIAQFLGCLRYWGGRLAGRRSSLIEYKEPASPSIKSNEGQQSELASSTSQSS